jgi:trans-aconitate 2-methyltransferase
MGWDPKTYLAFGAERTRPAADLLARVAVEQPRRVADLGCGPGNSTALLRARWPDAEIDAIDFAPEMLADARKSGVDARFIQADIAEWTPDNACDVIYSNAALQWLGNHESLLPRLVSFVRPGGVLAVQVPRNFEEHCHVLLQKAVRDPRWSAELKDVRDWWNVLNPEAYFDLLQPKASSVDLWETRYFHVIEGKDPVFHWMMGTGLRPFAAALKSPLKDEFLEHYRGLLAAAYPLRPGGQTIHRFLRLFFVVSV